jgi:hypothetical protein
MPKLAFRVSAIVPGKNADYRVVSFHVRYVSPPGVEPPPTRPGALTIELPAPAAEALETSEELVLILAPNLDPQRRSRLFS